MWSLLVTKSVKVSFVGTNCKIMSFWNDCCNGYWPVLQRQRRSSPPSVVYDREARIRQRYGLHGSEEGSTSHIELKIRIRTTEQDNKAKIFAIEATNVLPVLRKRSSHVDSGDEIASVQLRTKHLRIKARGRSGNVRISQASVLKFPYESKDCIQSLTVSEFVAGQIRFRLYNVFSRRKDILHGEYILNIPSLKLVDIGEYKTTSYDVIMELHKSRSERVKPPRVLDLRSRMRERLGRNVQSSNEDDPSHLLLQEAQSSRQGLSDYGRSRDFEGAKSQTEGINDLLSKTDKMRSSARGWRHANAKITQQKEEKTQKN